MTTPELGAETAAERRRASLPDVWTVPATPAAHVPPASPAVPAPAAASAQRGASTPPAAPGFDPEAARRDFPALHRTVHGRPLVWLDNAATTHKPRQMIEALAEYYATANSNIHRGAHLMAREATEAYEGGRETVAGFLGAESAQDIVFVRGTTEAVNLVAQTWGRANVGPGDDILVPVGEHHSNIVPWQQLAAERGARVVPVPLLPDGRIDQHAYADLLSYRTQLVALSQVSNVLGARPPLAEMIALAHRHDARVLVDGAQAVAHVPVDVRELDADFYAFSGHKVFAPTGIGALYAKPELLAAMPPWQGGGSMIDTVTFQQVTYAPVPQRFEAGTPNVAGVVGLQAALQWLASLNRDAVAEHERRLTAHAEELLTRVPGLALLGDPPERTGVLAFTLDGHDPAAVARHLDSDGIAVRAGHHCAQPTLRHFGLDDSARASLALYNTYADVGELAASLHRLAEGEGGGSEARGSEGGGPEGGRAERGGTR
jgi:cysteine desulfurase/selenocysteine lyase